MKLQAKLANSVDLSSIADVLDNVHQYEGYIASSCPFHDDLKPSFFVYFDWYRCLACGANGPTSTLLARLGKIDRVPSPARARKTSIDTNPFSTWIKHWTLKHFLKIAWQTINENSGLGNYITQDRGIEEPYRRKLGIGYIDDWYTIPIRNRHGIIVSAIARKGRDNSSQSKYVLPHGTNPNTLYIPNWKRVRDTKYLIITFGILDAITLAIIGEPAASTITGKQLSPVSVSRFQMPILIIPDHQEEADGLIAAQKLGWRGQYKTLHYPDRCKDINDIWVKDKQLCRDIVKDITSGLTSSDPN